MRLNRRDLFVTGAAALVASQQHNTQADAPKSAAGFGGQEWQYQSYLVLPDEAQLAAEPQVAVCARKWAKGKLALTDSSPGSQSVGTLSFKVGVELKIVVKWTAGSGSTPGSFETTGLGVGVTKGAEYQLNGWVFRGADGKIEKVTGAVRAVRGPDAKPEIELGGMPVGTVGYFEITKFVA